MGFFFLFLCVCCWYWFSFSVFFLFLTAWLLFCFVQLLGRAWLFATPWTATCQASLSFTVSWSLLRLTSVELVMPSNHLILCRDQPLLKILVRCHKVGINALTVCVLSGTRASSILVKVGANLSFHTTLFVVWLAHFFLLINNLPLYGGITVNLTTYLLKDILVASKF